MSKASRLLHVFATPVTVLIIGGSAFATTAPDTAFAATEPPADEIPLSWTVESPVIRLNDTGGSVAEWQRLLNLWLAADAMDDGFRLAVDSDFGPLTDAVTRSLQNAGGVPVDGIVGPLTRAAYLSSRLLAPGELDPAAGQPVLGRGDGGQPVVEWQQRLNTWISATGNSVPRLAVDGAFGPRTEEATRAFQSTHGVTVDGLVGPETRAAMRRTPLINGSAKPAPTFPGVATHPAPAETATPASGICPDTDNPVVTIKLGDSLGEPRCLAVGPDQRLRVMNVGNGDVTFFLAEHATILGPNNSTLIDLRFGDYLADGVHTIHVARFGGSGPQLWLRR